MFEIRPFVSTKDFAAVLSLYESVNWSAYTSDPERLERALNKSYEVLVALSDGEVVGLIRTVSDGEVICYIQDILVNPNYQRKGVGGALMRRILETSVVRQMVLMTDNEPHQRSFYQSLGFQLVEGELNAFVRLQ